MLQFTSEHSCCQETSLSIRCILSCTNFSLNHCHRHYHLCHRHHYRHCHCHHHHLYHGLCTNLIYTHVMRNLPYCESFCEWLQCNIMVLISHVHVLHMCTYVSWPHNVWQRYGACEVSSHPAILFLCELIHYCAGKSGVQDCQ